MRMTIAVRQTGTINDHRILKQIRVAFLRTLQLLHPSRKLLHVVLVDLRHLLHQVRLVHVVRQRMMPIRNPNLAIRPRRPFPRHQKSHHPRNVRLKSHRDHVRHQLEVFGKIGRHTVGLLHPRIDLRVIFLGTLQLLLDRTDRRHIFVQLPPVRRSQVRLQLPRIAHHKIEYRPPVLRLPRPRFGAQFRTSSKQPFKQSPRIEDRRQRLRLASPGQIIRVGARVSRVAIPCLPRVFKTHLKTPETRLRSHRIRHDLVHRDARFDIHKALARLYPAQVSTAAAAMIARPIEQRSATVVRQIRQQRDVLLISLQRLQNTWQLRRQSTIVLRRPVPHVDAVRHIHKGHAHGLRPRQLARCKCGCHRVQCRQGDRRANSTQQCAP